MTRWHHPGEPAEREVPVPLAHTDVRASIAGPIASVTLTQKFHNPYAGKIEALYLFPLPDDAAVNDFLMTIGGRTIRGVIREREEARQIYDAAKARGHHASLLSQERSNIFTQRVANIEPNETIDVSITYFHTLGYRDGAYEFVFPMVVGPRFHAGMSALRAGSPDTSIDTQYLRPHERSGHDVSINVAIDAAVPIESVESPSHAVAVNTDPINPGRASVTLAAGGGGTIPNRDFILRYRLGGDRIKGGLITHSDERGGYFCFTLVPPDDLRYSVRGPIELVFVVDCSGSMEGQPLALARRAVTQALAQLRPDDTFQVIRFSDTATFMTDRPVAASPFNIRVASDFVANLRANGGTVMLTGLEPALEARGDWDRTRFVCLLSDGLLDNEPEVLRRLSKRLGDSRVFSIGIGAAPNRALLNAMARIGRGAAAYIATEPEADETMNLFIERVSTAAMTNLKIDWGSLDVTDVYPKRLPDLYTGRPVTITGRYKNPTTRAVHEVKVTGRVGDRREALVFPIKAAGVREAAPALPMVWARARIQELDEYAGWGATPGTGSTAGPNKREIRDLALRYGLLSAHTSFIAVDSDHRTGGTYGTTVPVPVNMPQGMRYESTGGYER
jgi:Ca-activated chloride channel family protein